MKCFLLQLLLCSANMTLLAVIYAAISRTLRNKQSARWRYLSWVFLGMGFLTPYKPCILEPIIRFDPENFTGRISGSHDSTFEPVYGRISRDMLLLPDTWQMFFIIWVAGVILFLGGMLLHHAAFAGSVKRIRITPSESVRLEADAICREMGINRCVPVYIVPAISTPMLTGFFKPTILIPEYGFSNEELRLALKHELTHYMHGDIYTKMFLFVCRSIHWFNPVLPLLFRFAEQECELACDEAVMANEQNKSGGVYCQLILKIAECHLNFKEKSNASSPVVSSNLFYTKRVIKKRMKNIITGKRKRSLKAVAVLVCCATLFTGTFAAYAEKKPGENSESDNTAVFSQGEANEGISDSRTNSALVGVASPDGGVHNAGESGVDASYGEQDASVGSSDDQIGEELFIATTAIDSVEPSTVTTVVTAASNEHEAGMQTSTASTNADVHIVTTKVTTKPVTNDVVVTTKKTTSFVGITGTIQTCTSSTSSDSNVADTAITTTTTTVIATTIANTTTATTTDTTLTAGDVPGTTTTTTTTTGTTTSSTNIPADLLFTPMTSMDVKPDEYEA